MKQYKNIKAEREGQIGFLTINRPDVRNALNNETVEEIHNALEAWREEGSIGCIVFTGAGEKSFAAGADIGQLKQKDMLDALKPGMQRIYDHIEKYEKPTIAMVNGYALGGGIELAMACDIRVSSTNAKFGLPELNLAIIPGAGGTQRLTRIAGKGKALDMILRGKIIDAEEAQQAGLVSEVTSPEELLETTKKIAAEILAKGPLAVRLAKMVVHQGADASMETALLIEKLAQAIAFSSEDKKEGTSAFLEKRKAEFRGR